MGHQLDGPAVTVTTVLLTNAEEWPKCGNGPACMQRDKWPVWRGRPVVIELPPEEPDPDIFTCDTPMVWRMSKDWMSGAGMVVPETGFYVCVCVHQVQAD